MIMPKITFKQFLAEITVDDLQSPPTTSEKQIGNAEETIEQTDETEVQPTEQSLLSQIISK